ncbi:MAG: biopolymer transporter ExbD, partial [Bacteroidales bacterium]|nr:biopolymer transporter ExbD [Bacteroidales bacterium]MBQ9436103.1 biopolymer transporter ExbD [Bacteroidales bacterium]
MSRKMPSLNTSSSADISFLLLTFFLLTSSITNEQGIPR